MFGWQCGKEALHWSLCRCTSAGVGLRRVDGPAQAWCRQLSGGAPCKLASQQAAQQGLSVTAVAVGMLTLQHKSERTSAPAVLPVWEVVVAVPVAVSPRECNQQQLQWHLQAEGAAAAAAAARLVAGLMVVFAIDSKRRGQRSSSATTAGHSIANITMSGGGVWRSRRNRRAWQHMRWRLHGRLWVSQATTVVEVLEVLEVSGTMLTVAAAAARLLWGLLRPVAVAAHLPVLPPTRNRLRWRKSSTPPRVQSCQTATLTSTAMVVVVVVVAAWWLQSTQQMLAVSSVAVAMVVVVVVVVVQAAGRCVTRCLVRSLATQAMPLQSTGMLATRMLLCQWSTTVPVVVVVALRSREMAMARSASAVSTARGVVQPGGQAVWRAATAGAVLTMRVCLREEALDQYGHTLLHAAVAAGGRKA